MDWHQIAKLKISDLREKAKNIPGVDAVTGLQKEELVAIVAASLGVEKPHLVIEGVDKPAIKAEIRALKVKREEAIKAGDHKELKRVRRAIHKRKRALRRAGHLTH